MIKINLCPVDELENPYPFLPDAVMLAVVAVAAWMGVQSYLGGIQDEINKINDSTASLQQSTDQLQPEVQRFESLNGDIAELNKKLAALSSITVSTISRYKPVIVLEHLQNLRPEGVWFQTLSIGEKSPDRVEIKGAAFDNVLTAEFMTALRATEAQEADEADLRTQVYFSSLMLDASTLQAGTQAFPDVASFVEFTIAGQIRERLRSAAAAPVGGPLSMTSDDGNSGDIRL